MVGVFMLLVAAVADAQSGHAVSGIVRDPLGAVVQDADVQVLAARQRLAAAARTDVNGRFTLTVPEAGAYLIVIRAHGFGDIRSTVTVPAEGRWNSRRGCRCCART